MKKILCYGDSNTYGFIPQTCGRYEKYERWSGILSELLPEYQIIEEGMNNRVGFFKSQEGFKQSGGEYLSTCLQKHGNIDICILSLGTNDAQFFYNLDKTITQKGLQNLISTLRETNPDISIIIIPPVKIKENIVDGMFSALFDLKSVEKIAEVFPIFEQVAKENHCLYFDFNEYITPSELDGLHYSKESHKIIANHFAKFIQKIHVTQTI